MKLANFSILVIAFASLALDHALCSVPLLPDDVCAPNPVPSTARQLSAPFSTCSKSVLEHLASRHPDQNKNTAQILETYGYPYLTYNVTTADGYILTLYRITGSPNRNETETSGKKQAVYLQHGMTLASDCWNFQPGNRNLPFKLADAGYEVFLNNARGTSYSLGHTTLDSTYDLDYWNFSWHEMGIYDVPAVTDKIIEVTGNEKIFYVGHSMGTTQYFVSLSSVEGMNDKILAGFMLAPIAYMGHMNNPSRLALPFINTDPLYKTVNLALQGQIRSGAEFRQKLKLSPGDLCDLTASKCGLCDNFYFALFGYDAQQINNTELPNMWAKIPNSISVKVLAHYAQSASACTFRQYNYGVRGNVKAYGRPTPPDYQLDKITAPTYLFWGEQDNFGPPNDVMITARKLGAAADVIKVDEPLFNHQDFVMAKDADVLVYNRILEEMKKFQ